VGSWLVWPRPNPSARARLFCFPYAGGGASAFRSWVNRLPGALEVCLVQLPGRESRIGEPPFTRVDALIEAIVESVVWPEDKPFAFFGHSLGAIVAFELARELRRRCGRLPDRLLVSGARPPHLPDPDPPAHLLPDLELLQVLGHLKGTPPEILGNSELMQLLLPTLRADFALYETYAWVSDDPLPCPIAVYGGRDDRKARPELLEGWREHARGPCTVRVFSGGHFFIHESQCDVLAALSEDLTGA
jgi:medium-chain acyl-[acyl-carrier-protein] hydrolase